MPDSDKEILQRAKTIDHALLHAKIIEKLEKAGLRERLTSDYFLYTCDLIANASIHFNETLNATNLSTKKKEKINERYFETLVTNLKKIRPSFYYSPAAFKEKLDDSINNHLEQNLFILRTKLTQLSEIKAEDKEESIIQEVFNSVLEVGGSTAGSGSLFANTIGKADLHAENLAGAQHFFRMGSAFHLGTIILAGLRLLAIPVEYIYRRARGEQVPFMMGKTGSIVFLSAMIALGVASIFFPAVGILASLIASSVGLAAASVGLLQNVYEKIRGPAPKEKEAAQLAMEIVSLKDQIQEQRRILKKEQASENPNNFGIDYCVATIKNLEKTHAEKVNKLSFVNQKIHELKKNDWWSMSDSGVTLLTAAGLLTGVVCSIIPPLSLVGFALIASSAMLGGAYWATRLVVRSAIRYVEANNKTKNDTQTPAQEESKFKHEQHYELESTKNLAKQLFREPKNALENTILLDKFSKQLDLLIRANSNQSKQILLKLFQSCENELNKVSNPEKKEAAKASVYVVIAPLIQKREFKDMLDSAITQYQPLAAGLLANQSSFLSFIREKITTRDTTRDSSISKSIATPPPPIPSPSSSSSQNHH